MSKLGNTIWADLDGTLVRWSCSKPPFAFNSELVTAMIESGVRRVNIATNQGGMAFSNGVNKFATPRNVFDKIDFAVNELLRHGIVVDMVCVSAFHPNADAKHIARVRDELKGLFEGFSAETRVSSLERHRKPNPSMLQMMGAENYIGDSESDKLAAEAAGIPFVMVDRFL